jgi:hypothetical protein
MSKKNGSWMYMKYQVKKFQCKKCGITFDIESDFSIANQDYCSDCKLKKGDDK